MNKQDELRGLLKDILQDVEAEKATKLTEEKAARLETVEAEKAELQEKLDRLESTPAVKKALITGAEAEHMYKGYDLRMQGNSIAKDIMDDARKERHAKWLIDTLQKAGPDGLSHDTDEGDEVVPTEMVRDIHMLASLGSFAMQDCQVYNMGSEVLEIPVSTGAVALTETSEQADASLTKPVMSQVTLTNTLFSGYTPITNSLLEDSVIDLVEHITIKYAEELAATLDDNVLNGTAGSFTGALASPGVTSQVVTTSGVVTDANIRACIFGLTVPQRAGAKWYMEKTTISQVASLEDTNGNRIFQPDITGATPGRLYGYPIVENEYVPTATEAGSGNGFVLFGNLKNYALGVGRNGNLKVDPYTLMLSDQTRWVFYGRYAGIPLIAGAFASITEK